MGQPDRQPASKRAEPGLSLTKHHGLGNDFLIAVDPEAPIGADEARSLCDRRTGIGADGLILATPEGDRGWPRRWRMVLWNADGGRPEISGNGIRCLGQAIADHLGLDRDEDQQLAIETDAGSRAVVVRAAPADDRRSDQVTAGMGKAVDGPPPSERWAEVGVEPLVQRGVDVGNPHLVAIVGSLGDADMAIVGPAIEADYPGGVNVHLVEVLDAGRLRLRVWERGAGVTLACGSGACAAAWAANAAGLVGERVVVEMPGGAATVELGDDEISLTGPATRVAEVIVRG